MSHPCIFLSKTAFLCICI